MRLRLFLILLLGALAPASLSSLSAQDRFGSVTNEPRPSEYLHWDASAVAEIKAELQQGLADGNGPA